jgi:protein associated with RNAse G/E
MWERGQVIVHQEVWKGRVWAARPLVVVEDRADRMLLWIPKGTIRKVPVTPHTRVDPATREARAIENLDRGDWAFVEHEWDVSSLWILKPGDWHAVWVSWSQPGVQRGWYVNFQYPYRRTALGIDSMDLMLDLVVEPDFAWRLKDEEEFNEVVRRGIFDHEIGQRVREEARDVIEQIETNEAPFNEPWPSWRPDSTWTIPTLIDGWDVVTR